MPVTQLHLATRLAVLIAVAALGALFGGRHVRDLVRPLPAPIHGDTLANAYLIVRSDECEGALDFLELFERAEIKRRIRLDGVYVIGSSHDSAAVSAATRSRGIPSAVRRATSTTLLQRRALGYHGAVLVVTGRHEQVLLARALPSTPEAYVDMATILQTLPL